jgi:hypothetical protein
VNQSSTGTERRLSRVQASVALGLMTAAFFLRGVFLSLALPYGDPLDEPFHYGYAAYLAETGRIPRAGTPSMPAEALRPLAWLPRSTALPGSHLSWKEFAVLSEREKAQRRREAFRYVAAERQTFVSPNYESQQPPVFYWLAARLLAAAERAPLDRRLVLLRVAGSAAACLTVPLVYLFFRQLLPRSAALAGTLAFVAFPGLGVFVGRFTNDTLELPIIAALLVLIADVSRGRLSWRRAGALGALFGLGCWTKLYVLLLLPAAPLAALFASRRIRSAAIAKSVAASSMGLVLLLPWMFRQHSDTGDWLGLNASKQAVQSGVSLLERVWALGRLLTPRFWIVFGRTFLWPGTWSAMGAPAILSILLAATLALVALKPQWRATPVSPSRRRAWRGAGVAATLFLAGQLLYAGTYSAIGKLRGHAPSAGPDGWYLLVLFPVILTAGCAFGREVRALSFLLAAAVFLLSEWCLTLGVLPAVYGGWSQPNGANAPVAVYAALLASPGSALRVFGDVGLATGLTQRLAFAGWVVCLFTGFALQIALWRQRRPQDAGIRRIGG